MQEHQRKQSLARETAILAKVLFSQDEDLDDALVECERLASTAGTKIASGITQRRNSMNVATAFGKGKVEELAALVEHRR